jgi:MFS family permease
MKTITEYRPMVFSLLATHSEEHTRRRRQRAVEFLAVAAYGVLGLGLSFDTGFAPWQWQFWLMFAPLFVAGELAWRALLLPELRQTED